MSAPAACPPPAPHLRWLPSECHLCGVWPAQPLGQPVCGNCLEVFCTPMLRCPRCALVLETHRDCPCAARPSALTCAVAAVDYDYPWDGPIARFKFHGETAWGTFFARLMMGAPRASELLNRCQTLVPMPLTPKRLGDRGYNQAWILTTAVANQAPEHRHKAQKAALLKLHDTPPQHELSRAERLVNLRNAFAVPPQALESVKGQRLLLIDDIMTTGATLEAAAQALTMAGAAEVNALVFARTPRA